MSASDNYAQKLSAKAHFDGDKIVLDEPLPLATGTPLVVTVLSGTNDVERNERPNRFFGLLFGIGFILAVTQLFSQVTTWSYSTALSLTVVGSLLVMAALAGLGLKAYRNNDSGVRFTFSTVFLASIPLSVYLAALRVLLRDAPVQELTLFGRFAISIFCLVAMIVSTIILLSFAEAVVRLAVLMLRWQRTYRTDAGKP